MYGFVAPHFIFLFAPLILAGWLLVRSLITRRAVSTALGLELEWTRWRRSYLIILSALALTVIGLARPYWGKDTFTVTGSGVDRFLLVDISRSMLAKDIKPDRVGFAKRKISDFLRLLRARGATDRVALILFAGDAYVYCPLTDDLSVVKLFAESIDPSLNTALGSNLSRAFTVAKEAIESSKSLHPELVLLSDGEDDKFKLEEAVTTLNELNVRLDALGIGTPDGGPLMIDGRFVKRADGTTVVSKLNEGSLKTLAAETGGSYFRASLTDDDLNRIVSRGSRGTRLAPKTVTSHREIGPWFVAAGLVLMLIAVLVYREALIALIVCSSVSIARADERSAFDAYSRGDFDQAAADYGKSLELAPDDRALRFGLGSSLFRKENFKGAAEQFRTLRDSASNGREAFEAGYNLGNALLQQGDYRAAITAYDEALRIKPGDEAATVNRKIAEELLRRRPTATPTPGPSPTPSAVPSGKPSPTPTTGATPSPQASTTPSAEETATPSGSASPDPSAIPTPGEGSPAPDEPGEQQAATPTPSHDENSSRATPSAQNTAEAAPAEPTVAQETTPLSEQEANAWLDSLEEAPLLLRRHLGRSPQGDQTW